MLTKTKNKDFDCVSRHFNSRDYDYVHTVLFSLAFYIVLRPQGIRKQMKTLRKRHRVHITYGPVHTETFSYCLLFSRESRTTSSLLETIQKRRKTFPRVRGLCLMVLINSSIFIDYLLCIRWNFNYNVVSKTAVLTSYARGLYILN